MNLAIFLSCITADRKTAVENAIIFNKMSTKKLIIQMLQSGECAA